MALPVPHLAPEDVSRLIGICYDRRQARRTHWDEDARYLEWYHCWLTAPAGMPGPMRRFFDRLRPADAKRLRRFALWALGRIDYR